MKQSGPTSHGLQRQLDLRTGLPYANLMSSQNRFASVIGEYFGLNPDDVIPTSGATGAIEAARNHVFRLALKSQPVVLTVSPGYWRARESFQGFGFKVVDIETMKNGFDIDEAAFIRKATELQPEAVYLSLPNNPTGAIFDAASIVNDVPERTAVILDLTLPSRKLDTRELTSLLYRRFQGRSKLFLIGSTSKSHNTAEYRIGWVICACSEDAGLLRQENRNVVSSISVDEASSRLNRESPVNAFIERSFYLLKQAATVAELELIEPIRRAESSYVLIRFTGDPNTLRSSLEQHRIAVMWGSEFGLTDQFVRLEVSEPENVRLFIAALTAGLRKRQSA